MHRTLNHIAVQRFLVEHHVGLDSAAALAVRNHILAIAFIHYIVKVMEFMALLAIIPGNASVKLIDILAARLLMEAVNVLSYDSF